MKPLWYAFWKRATCSSASSMISRFSAGTSRSSIPMETPPTVEYRKPKSFRRSRNSVVGRRASSVKHSKIRSPSSFLPKVWLKNPISSGMIELKSTRPAVVFSHFPLPRSSSASSVLPKFRGTQKRTGVWNSSSSISSPISTSP